MNDKLLRVAKLFEKIEKTSSTNEKKQLLEDTKGTEIEDLVKQVLLYTYDTGRIYKIGKAKLKDMEDRACVDIITTQHKDYFSLLDYLSAAKGVPNELLEKVKEHILQYQEKEVRDLLIKITLKDLRCGVTGTIANKVWHGLVPQFKLQLAKKYSDREDKIKGEEIAITVKEDGIRSAFIIDDKYNIKVKTRQNKPIYGLLDILKHMSIALKENNLNNVLIDGELLYSLEPELDSGERYRKTVEIVNSDEVDKKNLSFVVFDIINLDDFQKGKGSLSYDKRRKIIEETFSKTDKDLIRPVKKLYQGKEHSKIYEFLDEITEKGGEGVMVNIVSKPYECKRTNNLLKVKKMQTADLMVKRMEEGQGKYEGMLGLVVVDYKGNEVGVGSGFNDKEREIYWKNPDNIVGKIIEVQYFEESQNKEGEVSLRLPIYKGIRSDKNEPSYY